MNNQLKQVNASVIVKVVFHLCWTSSVATCCELARGAQEIALILLSYAYKQGGVVSSYAKTLLGINNPHLSISKTHFELDGSKMPAEQDQ